MSKVKLRDSDPTDKLGLDELVDLVGDEQMPEIREKGAKRLQQLDTLSVATLERSMRRGNTQAAIYVHRTLHNRGVSDTVTLPKGWTKATREQRVAMVDKMLAKGALSPAQAREILDLGESVELQRDIESLKTAITKLKAGDQPAVVTKATKPKRPSVKRESFDDLL